MMDGEYMTKWLLKQYGNTDIAALANELSLSENFVKILAARGFRTKDSISRLLTTDEYSPPDMRLLKHLEQGADILIRSIKERKRIAVFGDYDVDGIVSCFLLYKALQHAGADCFYYIPHRVYDGYGLSVTLVQELLDKGAQTLFTCDNGISQIEEITYAKEQFMDVVILDHHEVPAVLPPADAVINPKQADCDYPFKQMATGGLSLKFVAMLYEKLGLPYEDIEDDYAFAAIATVCDIVSLTDENRYIVKRGLQKMASTKNVGLNALLSKSLTEERQISSQFLGYYIGPQLNAPGRLDSAKLSMELFCEHDAARANTLADMLADINEKRKELTQQALLLATEAIAAGNLASSNVLVLFHKQIDESVAGIVAGRLRDLYYKPAIVVTESGDFYKGSGRSTIEYDLYEEMAVHKHLYHKFGGHAMACGFSIAKENFDVFVEAINTCFSLTDEEKANKLRIDLCIPFSDINFDFYHEFCSLGPFGKDNESPVFAARSAFVKSVYFVGRKKNVLRFLIQDDNNERHFAISFKLFEKFKALVCEKFSLAFFNALFVTNRFEQRMDFVYSVDINIYNGVKSLQFEILDFRFSETP